MRKKRWIVILGIVLSVVLILNIISSFFFYHLAIERGPKDFLQGNEDLEVSAEAMNEFTEGDWIKWTNEQDFETMKLNSFDDISLQGYFLQAEEPTNKMVVFAHGYLGNAKDMGLFGKYYHEELGYNLFTPDLRGHGESGGDYYGFGWHDRLDIVDWLDQLVEENPDAEIVLHGLSMGAASVLMASGEDLPENVRLIIADSPYTSVYDLFAYQLDRMFHLPDKLVLPSMSVVTNARAGYTLKEASALDQVEKASIPVLYIHGEADTFVPTDMTKKLAKHTKSEHEIITFPDANHGESIVLHREAYLNEITNFIEKYIP